MSNNHYKDNVFVNHGYETDLGSDGGYIFDNDGKDSWVPAVKVSSPESTSSGVESLDPEDCDQIETKEPVKVPRKQSLSPVAVIQRRKQLLVEAREVLFKTASKGVLNQAQLQTLLGDRLFSQILFGLFDDRGKGELEQSRWIGQMKESAKKDHVNLEIVELIEAITYLVCQEGNVGPPDFQKIISTKGISYKITQVLGKERDEGIEVDEMMALIMTVTRGVQLTVESEEQLRRVFIEALGKDKHEITFDEFKKIVPCKDEFFVSRIFLMFDSDGSGKITLAEFIETIQHFANPDDDTKMEFLFNIFDINGHGHLTEENFVCVMRACMKENGMEFEEEELVTLANALFEDGVRDGNHYMTFEDFKLQLQRQEGLVNNMAIMINKWLVPPKPPVKKTLTQKFKEKLPQRYFTSDYWKTNKSFLFFLFLIFFVNVGLVVQRFHYFRNFSMLNGMTPNPFYMTSRACGRVLHANVWLLLFFVLRHTLTLLQRFGVGSMLPLDHSIFLHKVVGWLIFVYAILHSIAHLLNFAINIQPNPVKFVQLTWHYWSEMYGDRKILDFYKIPPGCHIVKGTDPLAQFCLPDSLTLPEGMNLDMVYNKGQDLLCQACPTNITGANPWTYTDWIFTRNPGLFGLFNCGLANPTGVGLISVLFLMVILSLPFVRRGGHFEVFYHSHRIGYLLFFVLLLLHAPDFWKWFFSFVGPVWIIEMVYRWIMSRFGQGRSIIKAGVILPSKVTNLIIERPSGFNFNAGDWVWVRIPAVSRTEWHPFTISSAPEVQGQFTLHIRGVGQWTNRLYGLFEEEYERQVKGYDRQISALDRIQGTVRQKYKSVKTIVNKSISYAGDNDEDTFVSSLREKTLEERKKERMEKRQEKLRRQSRDDTLLSSSDHNMVDEVSKRSLASVRYLSMRQPKIVKYNTEEECKSEELPQDLLEVVHGGNAGAFKNIGKKAHLEKPLEVYIDGPFGSPSSNIYRAEHAVLVGTNIGITPFASILQSIMHRYWGIKESCPNCNYKWTNNMESSMFKLRKVDFFWINRNQKSFEWFVNLLSQLEIEQAEQGGEMSRFLDMHMYVTSALQKTDMKAVALQMALDILHEKEDRDLITGLKSRTLAGRPNWNKVFTQISEQRKGAVTVFYCGNPALAKVLRQKCEEFGFKFRKETF